MVILLAGLAGLASAQSLTTSPASPVTYGTPVTLIANLTGSGFCGGVDVGFTSPVFLGSATTSQGSCIATLGPFGPATFPVGTYDLAADFIGLDIQSLAVLVVNQPTPTITLMTSGSPSIVGNPVTLTATVSGTSGTPMGFVSFFDGNSIFPFLGPVGLIGGTATGTTSALTAGSHSLTARYGGNTTYLSTLSTPVNQTVLVLTATTLTAAPSPSIVGQPVTLTANVSPVDAAGYVEFYDGNSAIYSADVNAGVVSLKTAALAPGNHSLFAKFYGFNGDSPYAGSTSAVVPLMVNQIATTTSLQASPLSSTPGQTVVLTATVSPPTAGGTVTFMDGSASIGTGGLSGGTASLSTSNLSIGSHSLTASYGGDTNDAPSAPSPPVTETVNRITTTTSLQAAPTSSTPGQNVVLTATVSPPSAMGTVTFMADSTAIGAAPLSGGTAIFSNYTPSIGSHSLTASYGGDTNDAPSVSSSVTESVGQLTTTTALVASPNPSVPGQNVTLSATVTPANATGTVTFLDGSNTIGSPQTLNGGTASISISTLSTGGHSLTASYGGDANDAPSVSPAVTESVGQTATTTSLKAAPTSSTPGQNVTLTAAVSPPTATGTVTFKDGSTTLGSPQTLTAGAATLSISTLSPGSHSLTASYAGDTNDAPSTSPPVAESVGQSTTATTTALAAAPNPSTAGQNVTLTATVTPGNPTGTVSFYDGASLLGSGSLSNGVATFSTSTLSAGAHSLTASYGGDANNAPSTSAAVSQSVTPASGRSITSLVPATIVAGSAAFTLTVNGTGFSSGAVVQWNGAPLATNFVTAAQVTATIPANLIASPGMVTITVVTTGGTTGGVTFLVSSQGQPAPVSVTPASGGGTTQSFEFQFSDTAGYQALGVVNVLINNFLDGRNACYLAYVVPSNTLVLVDDGGDAGGPYAGSIALGNSGTIQNSQCTVTLVSAIGNGTTLTLILSITFKPLFGGNRIMYMAARDLGAGNSNWQALGVWQAPFTPQGTIVVTGLTPGRGAGPSGMSQEFFVTLTDSKGASDFGVVDVLINNFIDGRQACYLAYVASTDALILLDDPGDAAGPYAGSIAPGGSGSIQNSQCMVSGAGSAVSAVSNTLTLTLNITFKAAFTGNRVVYAAGRDGAGGNNTDWQAMGTSTVQ